MFDLEGYGSLSDLLVNGKPVDFRWSVICPGGHGALRRLER